MNALHVNWTRPFVLRHKSFFVEDFELLTTILSAMKWRELNGKIKLCADDTALDYYDKTGLLNIWDETETLLVDDDTDPCMFWAAGKLFALRNQTVPIAVLDTDFIVWEKIPDCAAAEIGFIHEEELYPDVYLPSDFFMMKKGYEFGAFDFSLKAANGAFVIFKNRRLLEFYTSEAIRFMKNSVSCGDGLRYMVFAEQRLLPMCANALGIKPDVFSTQERLFSGADTRFTHIWGMKQQMRDNPALRKAFCRRCLARIKNDYPNVYEAAARAVGQT